MTYKLVRNTVVILFIVSVILIVIINVIPRGNFISAPAITLMIYLPLIILQGYILIQVLSSKNTITLPLKIGFWVNLFISLVIIYFFINFLLNTT